MPIGLANVLLLQNTGKVPEMVGWTEETHGMGSSSSQIFSLEFSRLTLGSGDYYERACFGIFILAGYVFDQVLL
jgi:hypothetical protein